jgi:hypothetical protein
MPELRDLSRLCPVWSGAPERLLIGPSGQARRSAWVTTASRGGDRTRARCASRNANEYDSSRTKPARYVHGAPPSPQPIPAGARIAVEWAWRQAPGPLGSAIAGGVGCHALSEVDGNRGRDDHAKCHRVDNGLLIRPRQVCEDPDGEGLVESRGERGHDDLVK